MIKAAALLLLQAAALAAGPWVVGPAAAVGSVFFLSSRKSRGRVRLGAGLFTAFFASLCLGGLIEDALGLSSPEYVRYGLLTLRGYASFLVALAGTRLFTLAEVLCFFKKIRIPGYILTMIYLIVCDLSVFNRLAAETHQSVQSRTVGLGRRDRVKLTVHAAKSYIIFAAMKFRYRHEHIQARGLSLDLPLDDWRVRERQRQSG